MNTVTVAELKRRGMAAIEEGLRKGPLHLVKRNKPAAVVLSEEEYSRLKEGISAVPLAVSAVQWLLTQRGTGRRRKSEIDKALRTERTSWE